ncbi:MULTISPECIES: OmpA/MotB family protein [unclassified Polaribacter]|uniref:OmpA/MotB family protein n=1 Tax=unclassified Polaribacter TaxID=196858 RepID=UPI000068CA45|nr:OmpA family protein [Polaribacter sp. MED152]EAQ41799.1 OmpA family protein [Polaribacter sp. MED152]
MRNLILPVSICMLMMTSCVSKKKYVELENKYTDAKGNLQKLQLKQEEIDRRVEMYYDKINSLKDDNANLEEENALKFDVNSDNIVISDKGRAIMDATLAKVDPKKLAEAKTLKDSLNLALSYNIITQTLGEAELLNSDELDIDIDETVVMISVSDKLLFNTGSYRVKESALSLITKIADIAESEPSIDIMIEGHTDSQSISNATVQDNWDLSVKRATSIVRLLQNKFKIDGSRLIASGRGDTVPLLPNTSSENRAKNRRTRIVILPNINKFFALLNSEK